MAVRRWMLVFGMLSLGGVGAEEVERQTILFLGDSLTAGYGLDKDRAFPALVQAKIDSLGWAFEVVNAGLSGETSAGGLRRIDWLLRRRVDVLILELGGNDGLRGISVSAMQENLQGMMDRVWKKYPDVRIILAGMEAPPNMGEAYTSAFRMVFSELRKKNKISLIPFLLEGVGGIPELNLADRIHPNVEGHRIVAENVWKVLKPMLEE